MSNDNVDLVFQELRQMGECKSRSDFSRDWLGRGEAYYRGVQSKGRQASTDAQVNLAARLRDFGMHMGRSDHPKIAPVGKALLKLYGDFLDAMLNQALLDSVNLDDFERVN